MNVIVISLNNRYITFASHILMYPLADPLTIWKYSCFTPIYKEGDILDQQNDRPISIICVIVKVFEQFIYNLLSKHLENTIFLIIF